MRRCSGCGEEVETRYRFCPWCAAPQRRKLTDFFAPHPEIERDRGRALRVSRYLAPDEPRHVRFSVWSGDPHAPRVDAAVSLEEREAARLARFLAYDAESEGEAAEDAQGMIHR